ncbi:MAG: molybdopterin-synthase adenylyltransferase MoeB [Cellvibrionaceae bacterium]
MSSNHTDSQYQSKSGPESGAEQVPGSGKGAIPEALTDEALLRYSRHVLLSSMDESKQLAILNARVLVVGVGGLGCSVLPYLVAAGVGHLVLVDGDKVEQSNLQRQILHGEGDTGKSKVQSAIESLSKLNSDCQFEPVDAYFSEAHSQLVANADVVVDCTDNLDTRNLLNRLCWASKTPLVSGSAIRLEGQLATFPMKEGSACYACLSRLLQAENLTCSQAGVLSPIVGVIGSLQATETLKVITGIGDLCENKVWLFDGLTMDFRSFKLQPNPDCGVCGQ